MSISVRLSNDQKKFLKSGDSAKLSVVRMIRAAVKNREIEKGASLDDQEVYGILMSLVRQGRDSIEQFSKGGRKDLADKETEELSLVQSYLPQQLAEEEISSIIKSAIEEVKPGGPGDIGKVMKAVMPKVKGRADGRLVSELVNKALAVGSSGNSDSGKE